MCHALVAHHDSTVRATIFPTTASLTPKIHYIQDYISVCFHSVDCWPIRISSKTKERTNKNIPGQKRLIFNDFAQPPAANSNQSRPGAGYKGPGVGVPPKIESL